MKSHIVGGKARTSSHWDIWVRSDLTGALALVWCRALCFVVVCGQYRLWRVNCRITILFTLFSDTKFISIVSIETKQCDKQNLLISRQGNSDLPTYAAPKIPAQQRLTYTSFIKINIWLDKEHSGSYNRFIHWIVKPHFHQTLQIYLHKYKYLN